MQAKATLTLAGADKRAEDLMQRGFVQKRGRC
jgi:hypothetical protein